MCDPITAITTIASLASAASSISGAFGGKPSNDEAANRLNAENDAIKKKRAMTAQQRKPTETFLTGGQGLAGSANGIAQGGALG